ncbi:polysaccharide biosynthesis tyrosine autokinase [Ramlibacter sp.]|uniref:polysaccharide biosynthesis tyrosine autokinase n=1 Tax=Ramlibacter sp. TaxID=1917967 RepID=UPI0026233AE6|nr:polysaccharide biosynthesis tyrosine autokinase [Ramlibacter sp.]MDB5957089.1 putative tyrosine-protein kinase [Ramlibacter sp.]
MNAPHSLQQLTAAGSNPAQQRVEEEAELNLVEYWDIIADNRWLVAAVTALAVTIGGAYALLAKPLYETNLLIQVEDSAGSAKSFLGEAASLFDVKTAAAAEIEILRSRMVLGQAVDNTHLYIEAGPRYLPLVGEWMSRHAEAPSEPGLLGFGGWVTGNEKIEVETFDVPTDYEGTRFRITKLQGDRFSVAHSDFGKDVVGTVGVPLKARVPGGEVSILLHQLAGKPGAQFNVTRFSRLKKIEELQTDLKLAEKGHQSGIVDASLRDTDRERLSAILNEIGKQYVQQNVERKAAEAQKTLAFLDVQLPQFKKQLDQSEEAYNSYRNQKGTVSLDEEAKLILERSVDLQSKLVEAQQRRLELVSRFTPEHPAVKTLDAQIAGWNREIAGLNSRVKALPAVQQDAVRLERDVKVNNELYEQLRNNAMQMQLIREGKIGNVRLIDSAAIPEEPVRPKRGLTLAIALALGLVAGVLAAITRNAIFRGIRNVQEIEADLGLNVYSTVPSSSTQELLARRVGSKQQGLHVLASTAPEDPAVESLRSLRTALQFAMLEAHNNCVLITGATPGVGKSFISANFSAVLASAGKRVLLIDADLRKGHLNQYFGVERKGGLSELTTGTVTLEQAIRKQVLPNLDFVPTGILPPNPAELVVSSAFGSLLKSLSAKYDLVIIDSAPVLVAADTLSVSLHAGTVLLVARADQTQLGELRESARRLALAGRTVSGVVFNALDLTRRHYGRYGYKYGAYQYRQYAYQPLKGE